MSQSKQSEKVLIEFTLAEQPKIINVGDVEIGQLVFRVQYDDEDLRVTCLHFLNDGSVHVELPKGAPGVLKAAALAAFRELMLRPQPQTAFSLN